MSRRVIKRDLDGKTLDLDIKEADTYEIVAAARKIIDTGLTVAIDYDGGANPVYVGEATADTAKSVAAWRIKKITWSGSNPTDIQWADGESAFVNIWNSRTTYSYS